MTRLAGTRDVIEGVHLAREPDFDLGAARVRPSLSEVVVGDLRLRLQPRVMQVLVALARAEGEVVSRDDLIALCWGGLAVGEDALNRCVQRLRRLSAEAPGAFAIETIPRVGYRLERAASAEATDMPVQPEAPPERRSGTPSWRRPWVTLAAVVGLAAIAVLLLLTLRTGGRVKGAEERLIAVEPLQVRNGDAPAQIVRLGLSDDLARAMVGHSARFSVEALDASRPPPPYAQFVLSGNAVTTGADLHAQVRLRNVRSDEILWSRDFSGESSRADALREQVAIEVGAVLNCALSTRHRGHARIGDDAIRLYLAACDHISDFDLGPALDLLRQVTALAPGFARAWADLATTQALAADNLSPAQRSAAMAEAASNARRALTLDPGTGLAYYALAQTMPGIANWSRRTALVRKGLHVEPDGSELNNELGDELLEVGRSSEGLAYFQRSMDFDPLDPVKTATLIAAFAHTGHFDDAEVLIAKAGRIWPHNPLIWRWSFKAEARYGDPIKAEAMLEAPDRPSLHDPAELAFWQAMLRARLNPTPANLDAAARVAEASPSLVGRNEPLLRAYELASLGSIDRAYDILLPRAAALDDDSGDELLFRAGLQKFRADPRFMTLAKRLGLVSVWRSAGRWPDFCASAHAPYPCASAAERAPD